jgi:tetratricopeptide (TPR) repeat protein
MEQEFVINAISDRLCDLSFRLKSREHSATVLEGVCTQFFNVLFGWQLINLNQDQGNFPGVDLGDGANGIALQITVQNESAKAMHTLEKIDSEGLRGTYRQFICFFLVEKAPGSRTTDPADFRRWGIRSFIEGILKPLHVPQWLKLFVPTERHTFSLERLAQALRILEETLGRLPDVPESRLLTNLPFPPNPHFSQRDAEMAALERALESAGSVAALTQTQVVHGLGGVGKTQLAVQYAWLHRNRFTALLWLPADSESSILTGLARIYESLSLPAMQTPTDAAQAEAVLKWLRDHTGWLLIADNADSTEAQTALLTKLSTITTGCVIITSCLEDWDLHTAPIPLDAWTDDQGAAWLCERLTEKKLTCLAVDANALSHALGGLPLALEQAAAYMTERRIGPAAYLKRFRAHADATQNFLAAGLKHGGGTRYEKTVATTWLLTLQQLTPLARAALKMIAWLGPEEIPRHLFTEQPAAILDAAQSLDPVSTEDTASPAEAVEAALALLARYSLIKLSETTLTCHRLVQTTQRWQEPKAWLLRVIAWVNVCVPSDPPPNNVRSWPRIWNPLQKPLEALLAHEQVLADKLSPSEATLAGLTRLLNQLGLFYGGKANLLSAEPLHRRVISILEASLGPDNPNLSAALNNLALLLQATNRLAEAEELMRRALKIGETNFGHDHPNVTSALNNLAQLLKATNRLAEAEELMRRALKIDEASYGPDHPEVATDLNNLATLLKATNRLAEAEEPMRRALKIDEASYGLDHPNVAIRLNNLAQLLKATNRLVEAEEPMRRALKIDEASYGLDHPNVAIRLNNLASLLQATNRLAEAEEPMRRVVSIFEASLGPDHPNVATALNNLASLLQITNRLAEAEEPMRRALRIDEASYGPDHPDVATDLNNLAQLLQATNRLAEAEEPTQRVLVIFTQFTAQTGHEHPHLRAAMNNYFSLMLKSDQTEEKAAERLISVLVEGGMTAEQIKTALGA